MSDSDWWLVSRVVRSGEEVEVTGEEPPPVELVTLQRPVLPVPRLSQPLSHLLPPCPALRGATTLLCPWFPWPCPTPSSSGWDKLEEEDFDLGIALLLLLSPSARA